MIFLGIKFVFLFVVFLIVLLSLFNSCSLVDGNSRMVEECDAL